jgi:hypothetical protein
MTVFVGGRGWPLLGDIDFGPDGSWRFAEADPVAGDQPAPGVYDVEYKGLSMCADLTVTADGCLSISSRTSRHRSHPGRYANTRVVEPELLALTSIWRDG